MPGPEPAPLQPVQTEVVDAVVDAEVEEEEEVVLPAARMGAPGELHNRA